VRIVVDGVQRGYLVIADISGYTAFLAGSELTHANEIMGDLTSCVVDNLRAPIHVVKFEGDAVFAYAPEPAISEEAQMMEDAEATGMTSRMAAGTGQDEAPANEAARDTSAQ